MGSLPTLIFFTFLRKGDIKRASFTVTKRKKEFYILAIRCKAPFFLIWKETVNLDLKRKHKQPMQRNNLLEI